MAKLSIDIYIRVSYNNYMNTAYRIVHRKKDTRMKDWQLQVQYLDQLLIIELEQDQEPSTQDILKEIRRVFGTQRLRHDQLHYMFC